MPNPLVEAKASAIKAIEILITTLDGLLKVGQDADLLREAALSAIADTILLGIQPIIARISQNIPAFDTETDEYQRQQNWLRMRNFEALLHGSVQGLLLGAENVLHSAALEPGETISELIPNLSLCIEELKGAAVESFNFEVALERYIELWNGVIAIDVLITPAASDVLSANQTAAQCALEVIREGINNAVKHGKPRNMEVEVGVELPWALSVRISNDGSRLVRRTKRGFGSEVLDQLTSEWEIGEVTDRVELRALVSTRRAEQHGATDNA